MFFDSLFTSSKSILIENKKKELLSLEPVFYEPEFVYIPISIGNKKFKPKVNINSEVRKGTIVSLSENDFPIFSPVSGKVISKLVMPFSDFTIRECFKIQNDKLNNWEKSKEILDVNKVDKADIFQAIKNSGVYSYKERNKPVYLKFAEAFKINTLLIEYVETNPYIAIDQIYAIKKLDYLFHILPFIKKLTSFTKAILCINKDNFQMVEEIKTKKKLYNDKLLDIKLIENKYPNDLDRNLVRIVEKKEYISSPIEVKTLVLNIYTLEMLGRYFLEGKKPNLRCYSFNGYINKKQNIVTSFGVLVSELINNVCLGIKNNKNIVLFDSNPISGLAHVNSNYVLTMDGCGTVAEQKNTSLQMPCISCSKCLNNCPSNLQPIKIIEALNNENTKLLKNLNAEKCINCGICSYVCPSNIDVALKCYDAKKIVEEKNGYN